MPILLEQIAPSAEADIFGDAVDPEARVAFAGRLAYLPVCTYLDLENTILYSHNPYYYEQQDQELHPTRGDAYAWRRLPRFLDRFKEVRERMRDTCPNELLLSLDVGSSVPIYSEMMRAHWLRKCGDHAQQGLKHAVDVFEDKSRVSNAMLGQNMRRDSTFKNSFISCLQMALYCIPYELGGDEDALRAYLEDTMRMLLASCTGFIDRKERKNEANLIRLYDHLSIDYDPSKVQRTPMERAWRIDMALDQSGGTQTPHQMLQETTYTDDIEDSSKAKQAQMLYRRANKANAAGDEEEAARLRDEASMLLGDRRTSWVDSEEAAYLLEELLTDAVEYVVGEGYAPPVRFISMDMRDPLYLLEEATVSLDAETKLSGFGRRTFERALHGDPDHIHDQISNIRRYIAPEMAASITSIDSFPVHAEPPRRVRDMGRFADEISRDMGCLAEILKKRGEYMTFSWGKIGQTAPASRLRPFDWARNKAIRGLPREVEKRLIANNSDGQYLISLDLHSKSEVRSWMSQGEFDTLLGISPTLDLDEDERVKVMRIRRHKEPTPSGRLLGATQLR